MISLFFFLHKTLLPSRPLHDDDDAVKHVDASGTKESKDVVIPTRGDVRCAYALRLKADADLVRSLEQRVRELERENAELRAGRARQ